MTFLLMSPTTSNLLSFSLGNWKKSHGAKGLVSMEVAAFVQPSVLAKTAVHKVLRLAS